MPSLPPFPPLRTAWLIIPVMACLVGGGPQVSSAASLARRTAVVRAVEQAAPSVVNIRGRKTVRPGQDEYQSESDFGPGDAERQVNGMGTGVVIDQRGYIVTNYHVVEDVRRIQVTTAQWQAEDGRIVKAKTLVGSLIARDPKTDLAIIKVDVDEPLPVIRIGTSNDLMPGEPVIAVGNAYGYEHTVTRGIISALHRTVQVSDQQTYVDLIQTDASINPGNSGGPLLNIDGDMIGINVAVRIGAQGIAFAVPIDQAIDVVAQLLDSEVTKHTSHGVAGRTVAQPGGSEFVVSSLPKGAPGDNAGLQPGDVITAVADQPIQRALDFERALLGHRAGDEIKFLVRRNNESLSLSVVLAGATGGRPATISDQTWELLGMKLAPISASAFRQLSSRYRGGLKVVAVRPDGPAARQGIRYGDVLVGMHKWETISLDNVAFILESDELKQSQPVKFFILRGGETLYGHMQVSLTAN